VSYFTFSLAIIDQNGDDTGGPALRDAGGPTLKIILLREVVMIIPIAIIFLILAGTHAFADETNALPAVSLWWAHSAITVLGVTVVARCAYQAFNRPPLQLADVPTFPKYMTSQRQYRLGSCVYVLFAAAFFLLLVFLHREVVSVIEAFGGPVSGKIVGAIKDYSASYLLIIAAMGIVYLYLLTKEAQWNVLLMMRDLIQAWISIPTLANDVVVQIQCCLHVPGDAVAEVVTAWPSVSAQDFSKGKNTIDRSWAEVCYMRWWLGRRQDSGSDARFFAEQSFAFNKLLEEFEKLAVDIARLERGSTQILAERVTGLHNKLARLVACYLIYRNDDRTRLISEAAEFGITLKKVTHENPLAYSIVYILTLIACVYVGVYLSAIIFDWMYNGNTLYKSIILQDGAKIHSWIIYTAGNYGVTIILILSLRMGARALGMGSSQSYLVTYSWTFFIALVTGPFILAILAKYLQPIEPYASMQPVALFYQMLIWGLGPALISVYITYYLDRQTSSDLPKIDHSLSTVGWRLLNSFAFGAGTVLLLLPSLLTIPRTDAVAWEPEKLRFVSTGTTFLLSVGLALAAQFALRKRSQTPRDKAADPDTAAAGVAN
jgi:hypothetical protein